MGPELRPTTQASILMNTKVDPPRAIWHYLYDDDEFMNSVSPEEIVRIQGLSRHTSHHDIAAESTDDEGDQHLLNGAPTSSSGKASKPRRRQWP